MKKKKLTVTKMGEKYICKYVLDVNDEVDTKVFEMGLTGRLSQVIPCSLDENNGERTFVYEISDKVSLGEFMKREMSKKQMLILLYNILSSLEQFGTNMVSLSYVVKDTQYIFVNPDNSEVYYIVVATDKEISDLTEIRNLIREIIVGVSYSEGDNDNYVARLITYVNKPGTFSIIDTRKFIEEMLREMNINVENIGKSAEMNNAQAGKVSRVAVMQNSARMNQPSPMPYGQPMPMNGQPMPNRPMPMNGQPMPNRPMPMNEQPMPSPIAPMPMNGQPVPNRPIAPMPEPTPEPSEPVAEEPKPMPSPIAPMPMNGQPVPNRPIAPMPEPTPEPSEPVAEEPKPMPSPIPPMPSPIPPMPSPIPVFQPRPESKPEPMPEPIPEPSESATEEPAEPMPYLLRVKSNEKIYIDKPEFTIGKSSTSVDYTVQDNTAVSRIHCIINRENGVSYIKDNDSTNGTYLNGRNIKGEDKIFLTNNAKLVLGDEEFIYFVK